MNRFSTMSAVLFAMLLGGVATATAGDTEGCLHCHRYRGLAAVEPGSQTVELYYVDPAYYERGLGPHVRLKCTDCHKRDEVNVIPHLKTTPVVCTQTCHLSEPGQVERRFAHQPIAGMLDGSVHTEQILRQSSELLGRPIDANQSVCLLCHDEPTFRPPGHNWADMEAPIGRCNVCHDAKLPVDTSYYFWHVEARTESARNNQDTVRVCALCHANDKVREHFELPNSIASYLASFHGKATLLGSQETAECLDCHVSQSANVHMIQSHEKETAATFAKNLDDTCRTPRCHPKAGAQISTAAVHLDLAASGGVEWIIAFIFILLILFTFGPSVMLTALKMFQVVVGRHDPGDHNRHHRAERIMQVPRGRELLKRFNFHQRVQHWILVVTFASLVLTGFPMKFADRGWAAWLINLLGGLTAARVIHRVAGVMLLIAMVYHLIYIGITFVKEKRRSGRGLIRSLFALPMMITLTDLKQMGQMMAFLLFLRKERPQFDRFNLEEKFEYIGVFWGTFLLGATGALMWANAWTSQYFPGRLLTIATLCHTMEALLALLHVGVVHMITVIFQPAAFPISPAMFTGDTPAEEMAEAHGKMIERAEHELGLNEGREEVAHG